MHDRNGTPLQVGDRVMLEATVTQLHGGEDFCNVTVQSIAGRRPDGSKETVHAINTGVLTLVERPAELSAAAIAAG